MQAASMVTASAAPRSTGESATARSKESPQGANAFTQLLSMAEEQTEATGPNATLSGTDKDPTPLAEAADVLGARGIALEVGKLAKEAATGNSVDLSSASPVDTPVALLAEETEASEAPKAEDVESSEAINPDLSAWLASLLQAPSTTQAATQDKRTSEVEASTPSTTAKQALHPLIPTTAVLTAGSTKSAKEPLPKVLQGSTKDSALEHPDIFERAEPAKDTRIEQDNETTPAKLRAEAHAKPSTSQTVGTTTKAPTQLASAEPGAPNAQALIKPLSPEPSSYQPQTATPVFGPQSLRENVSTTPSPSTTRSEAFVQASVHSPAFAPAFSARIATLARDGLELARVHLNPVDMGPVSVQLSLDGQQVRVDMTADVAATRRVLEQALPSLAGALREAGFTLSGGGVYQPPPDGRQGPSQDTGANGSSNPQGAGTPDNLSSSAGGAGGQSTAANPFREDPHAKGTFSASRLLAVGEDGAASADGTPSSTTARQRTGLVDVFA